MSADASFSSAQVTLETSDGWRLALHVCSPAQVRYPWPWLCVHGFSQSHLTWTAGGFAQRLAALGCPVYVLDLRGHGDSARALQPSSLPETARAGWTLDDYFLRDLPAAMAQIRQFHPVHPMILCGHSMGGIFSVATALRLRGEGLRAVVAIASPLDCSKMSLRMRLAARASLHLYALTQGVGLTWRDLPMAHFFTWMDRAYFQTGFQRVLAGVSKYDGLQLLPRVWTPNHVDEDTIRQILQHSYPEPMDVVLGFCRWILAGDLKLGWPDPIDYVAWFERFDLPVMVAWGEADFLAPPATGALFLRAIKSRIRHVLRLSNTHHVDITAGTPANTILQQVPIFLRRL